VAGSRYERVLAAEVLVVMSAQTVDALSGSGGGGFSLPDPSRYFAAVLVYMSLAAVAMFGDRPGKLAAGFGGVAALAMLMAPTKRTGKPLAMSLVDFFAQLTGGGVEGAANASSGPAINTPGGPTGPVVSSPSSTPGTVVGAGGSPQGQPAGTYVPPGFGGLPPATGGVRG
jgi:hypothetical protein